MKPNGERVRMELDFDKYKAQQCCDNPACQYNGKMGEDNIRTHSRQHQQVYCNACNNIWVITKGTFLYNLKAPVALVLEVLRLLSEGMGLRAVCRTKGVTPDAVGAWLIKAAEHMHEVTVYLERAMHLTQCQIDDFGDCSKDTGFIQPVPDGVRRGFVDGLRLGLHATYPGPTVH